MWHKFRHTYASTLAAGGVKRHEVQEYLIEQAGASRLAAPTSAVVVGCGFGGVAQPGKQRVQLLAFVGAERREERVLGFAEGLVGLSKAALAGGGDRDDVASPVARVSLALDQPAPHGTGADRDHHVIHRAVVGEPGAVAWFPDRTYAGRTYIPASTTTTTGYELFGYVSFEREHEGGSVTTPPRAAGRPGTRAPRRAGSRASRRSPASGSARARQRAARTPARAPACR